MDFQPEPVLALNGTDRDLPTVVHGLAEAALERAPLQPVPAPARHRLVAHVAEHRGTGHKGPGESEAAGHGVVMDLVFGVGGDVECLDAVGRDLG